MRLAGLVLLVATGGTATAIMRWVTLPVDVTVATHHPGDVDALLNRVRSAGGYTEAT
ncbi:MAG: hypothetical protein Q8K63_12510 [Acidimicrobiales bacterium]|nr:hypothetical protein [Acidimicrobiales bacterium]